MAKRIGIILLAVLLAGLLLYYVPLPRTVEFHSPCVEVDRQGNILSNEGEILLKGTYYHYLFQPDTFSLTSLEIPGAEVVSSVEYNNGPPHIMNSPKGYDFIWFVHGVNVSCTAYRPRTTDIHYISFFTHPDFPYLIFDYNNHDELKYYITTNNGAPDPVSMLKEFCLYQENSEN